MTSATQFGTVLECLPNFQFKILLKSGREYRAYLAGKMKLNRIKVLIGDQVEVVVEPTGPVGRVVRRVKAI